MTVRLAIPMSMRHLAAFAIIALMTAALTLIARHHRRRKRARRRRVTRFEL